MTRLSSSAAANANSVSFAEGNDSLSLNRGLTNGTVVAAGGNDTVVAALTLLAARLLLELVDDSLSISVLSNSTVTGASGADTITIAGNLLTAQVYGNQALTAFWWAELQRAARFMAARAMTC